MDERSVCWKEFKKKDGIRGRNEERMEKRAYTRRGTDERKEVKKHDW